MPPSHTGVSVPNVNADADDDAHSSLSEDEVAGFDVLEDPEQFGWFQVGRDFESSKVSHKFTNEELKKMAKYEGLDYYREENVVYHKHKEERSEDSTAPKWAMFFMVGVIVGLLAFVLFETNAFLLDLRYSTTLDLVKAKKNDTYLEAYLSFVLSGVVLAGAASILVVFIAPAAGGSGVPDVMGYLNGVLIPHVFNVKTFVVKLTSCTLAVGSGMPVGPEGPIIHVGALLGAALPMGRSRTMGFTLDRFWERVGLRKHFESFRQPKEHRDFISGGAAAGVSAAFSAPVGGLLFVFEEVASFWEPRLTWMVFFACLMSSFTNSLFQSSFEGWKVEGTFGYFAAKMDIIFPLVTDHKMNVMTMIPAVLIAVIGGALGALFTFLNLKILRMRLARFQNARVAKVIEVMVICAIYSSILFVMAVSSTCKDIPANMHCDKAAAEDKVVEQHFLGRTYAGSAVTAVLYGAGQPGGLTSNATETAMPSCKWLVHHVCDQMPDVPEPNRYSPLATLCFTSGEKVIKHLFTTAKIGVETEALDLFIFLLVYFTFSCWCAGMAISSGLVIPMLITGALMGRLVGRILESFITAHWIDTSVFALLGASAFFGGVSRLTISLAVIMLEISGGFHFLLPIMAAVLIAKWLADFVTHSLYHAILEVKCVPFLDFLCDIPKMECFSASDVMQAPVVTLNHRCSVRHILTVLKTTSHNGFPVLCKDRMGNRVFKGMILRSQLLSLIKMSTTPGGDAAFAVSSPGSSSARHPPRYDDDDVHSVTSTDGFQSPSEASSPKRRVSFTSTFSPGGEATPLVQYPTMNRYMDVATYDATHGSSSIPEGLNHSHRSLVLDLSIFVNTSSFTVNKAFAVNIVRNLFRTMALRHLPVVNDSNEVVGMITRKDLTGQAIEKGMAKRASMS